MSINITCIAQTTPTTVVAFSFCADIRGSSDRSKNKVDDAPAAATAGQARKLIVEMTQHGM